MNSQQQMGATLRVSREEQYSKHGDLRSRCCGYSECAMFWEKVIEMSRGELSEKIRGTSRFPVQKERKSVQCKKIKKVRKRALAEAVRLGA